MTRRIFLKSTMVATGVAPLAKLWAADTAGPAANCASRDGEIAYSRTLPVKVSADVFIAGGGPAGVAAAVAARSAGASVFLVARQQAQV